MSKTKNPSMTSSKPYLIRALYEWINENHCTPYLLVNAFVKGVQVPQEYVKDGQIVLNTSPTAVQNFLINNQAISFNARFGGIPMDIHVPVAAVMGIYTKENGQGMMFEVEEPPEPTDEPPKGKGPKLVSNKDKEASPSSAEKPSLRVVK